MSETVCRWILFGLCIVEAASVEARAAGEIDFDRDVRPILSDTCFKCHGPDANARQAELRLDTEIGLKKVVTPGKPNRSKLFQKIVHPSSDERMPPEESKLKLTRSQIDVIKRWVEQGGKWSGHWAFQARRDPKIPAVKNPVGMRNSIDAFIRAKLEAEGLPFSPPADKTTLIRRVSLDLTGLPPSPADVETFLNDDSPNAYERLVDRLLASPRYGERMAWEWMDASRYADTNGYQGDPTRTMWPWRDWLVNQLNRNQPFDRMTIEMLAGDLLPNRTPEQILATGFNRNHPHNGEGGRIAEETRIENVFDRTETTATVWLGMTATCCRCHDHKFDPITQREYFRLFAYFNRSSERGSGRGQIPPTMRYRTPTDRRDLAEATKRVEKTAVLVAAMEKAHRKAIGQMDSKLAGILKKPPRRRSSSDLAKVAAATKKTIPELSAALTQLKRQVDVVNTLQKRGVTVMIMDEVPKPRTTYVLTKGLYNKPEKDKTMSPGVPSFLPPMPQKSPANRLALARWIVDPKHPLTARVAVNRIWQQFFGTGLVKTSEDFGVQGERPSHPQLLDWLAGEFIRGSWDVKAMHRLIVTSATYRRSTRVTKSLLERDPENRLLARAPRYRLPSWMIRDQALTFAGLLRKEFGGPPVKPYQPAGIWAEATFGKIRYRPDTGEKLYRRSLYIFWRRIVSPTTLFDPADRTTCTVRVTRTSSPLHALVTLNDPAFVEAARVFAQRVIAARRETRDRLSYAFQMATSRAPNAAERMILENRLTTRLRQFTRNPKAATELLSVGESKVPANIKPQELAAWTSVCMILLNLDEVITKP